MTSIQWLPRELPTHGQMTLPRGYFVDPVLLREESEKLFGRQWLCVDREERVARAGDFFAERPARAA